VRKPFIIAFQTERKLTALQSFRRGRLIEKSKTYHEHLKRLRRQANRRGDQKQLYPVRGGMMFRPSPLNNPEACSLLETMEALDAGMFKPHKQIMLELGLVRRARQDETCVRGTGTADLPADRGLENRLRIAVASSRDDAQWDS